LDTHILADHPLRAILALINEALSGLSRNFDGFTRETADRRSRRNGCYGRCCKRSTRYARTGQIDQFRQLAILFLVFVGPTLATGAILREPIRTPD
jgi:hypothetical protein